MGELHPISRCANSAWSRRQSIWEAASRVTLARSIYDYSHWRCALSNNGQTIQVNADPGSACVTATRGLRTAAVSPSPPERASAGRKKFDLDVTSFTGEHGRARGDGCVHSARAANAALKAFFESMPVKEGPEVRVGNTMIRAVLPKSGGYFTLHGLIDHDRHARRPDLDGSQGTDRASVEQIQKFAARFRRTRARFRSATAAS